MKKSLKELESNVLVQSRGCGQYLVAIKFRGYTYKCNSNNSIAWDSLDDQCDNAHLHPMTRKQALLAFYNECKAKNNL